MVAQHRSNRLALRIPPLALVAMVALLMRLCSAYLPAFQFQFKGHSMVAIGLALLGLTICTLGFLEFQRAKTTANPINPHSASSLVTSGIYRHTRNPMYFGFLLILAGIALWTANALSFLGLPAFIFYLNRFQIKPEETALASIFGDEFKAYCSRVRRWV